MAKKNECMCGCGHGMMMFGVAMLIVAAMLYYGYGWFEVFAVLGILAILKGIFVKFYKK